MKDKGYIEQYPNHPGFDAIGCPAQQKITVVRPYSTSNNGYACLAINGHCLPDKDKCPARVKSYLEWLDREDFHPLEML